MPLWNYYTNSEYLLNPPIGTEDQWCAPNGLKYHFVDIYFSELARVCLDTQEDQDDNEAIQVDQLMSFLEPFCQIVAYSKKFLFILPGVHFKKKMT